MGDEQDPIDATQTFLRHGTSTEEDSEAAAPTTSSRVAFLDGPRSAATDANSVAFDYEQITDAGARSAMQSAESDIQNQRNHADIKTGLRLLELKEQVKEKVGPGRWMAWYRDRLGFSGSAVDRYMGIARIYKVTTNSPGLRNSLENAPKDYHNALYEAPEQVRARELARLQKQGVPTPPIVLRAQSRQHRELERAADTRQQRKEKAIRKAKSATEAQERLQAAIDGGRRVEEQQRNVAEQIVAVLAEQIDDLLALTRLFEESDARESIVVRLLRERASMPPPGHGPPPGNAIH